jgi:hypothetical protein
MAQVEVEVGGTTVEMAPPEVAVAVPVVATSTQEIPDLRGILRVLL